MFKLFVGNLSFHTSATRLRQLFAQYGEVAEVFIGTDRQTGRSRGFGFVSMGTKEAGELAIAALNGKPLEGRTIVVNAGEKSTNDSPRVSKRVKRTSETPPESAPPTPLPPPKGWDGHHDSSRQWDHGRARDEAHDQKREGRFERED
ncbi:MAG: hypothetical protein EXS10_07625 [Phycisphaerales bacterium]|nr:hypothetical protein [Phycisphaerales bacterium]